MELKHFEGQDKKELSLIEVAHAILEEEKEVLDFSELLNRIQDFLALSSEEVRQRASQFYTDLNIDGSFISLGDNRWALRSWYPIDSIDEEVTQGNEEDVPRRKRKKVSAFVSDDDIDYNDDDPEDEADDLEEDSEDEDELEFGKTVNVDEHGVLVDDEDQEDLGEYQEDLSKLGADDDEDDEFPDGVEGDLSLISDEDEDSEEDHED